MKKYILQLTLTFWITLNAFCQTRDTIVSIAVLDSTGVLVYGPKIDFVFAIMDTTISKSLNRKIFREIRKKSVTFRQPGPVVASLGIQGYLDSICESRFRVWEEFKDTFAVVYRRRKHYMLFVNAPIIKVTYKGIKGDLYSVYTTNFCDLKRKRYGH